MFVRHPSCCRCGEKGRIIPNDVCLTHRCLSVIDKSWERRYSQTKTGCISPIGITVWSGFAGWNHMKTNPSAAFAFFALPFFFLSLRRSRSYPNPSVLSMQITCRRVDIHYAARLWLDMKLSCCLHQLWLRGLSGLCSNAVWEWRRYSNKAIRVNWPQSNVLYFCSPWQCRHFYHPMLFFLHSAELNQSLKTTQATVCTQTNTQLLIYTPEVVFISENPLHAANLDSWVWMLKRPHKMWSFGGCNSINNNYIWHIFLLVQREMESTFKKRKKKDHTFVLLRQLTFLKVRCTTFLLSCSHWLSVVL